MDFRRYSLRGLMRRALFRARGRIVYLKPYGTERGRVLFSYITLPFTLLDEGQLGGHTNYWEAKEMAEAWREEGYAVDVIDLMNKDFVPKKQYDFFIDNRGNLQRLSPFMPHAVKIFHATNASAETLNIAEEKRIDDIKKRRGAALLPRRKIEPYSTEAADVITSVCGRSANATYLPKKIYQLPLSTTHMFEKPEKDFDKAKNQFIWFGGAGAVHKGLDLVLESFAQMPTMRLVVCGKFEGEKDFVEAYRKELYETQNIIRVGYVDPGSETFVQICKESVSIVYPSSSEGCASSVVIAMHAGLIPIVSHETGVEVGTFGAVLRENSIDEIIKEVKRVAALPRETLRDKAEAAWEYARTHHTREAFAKSYRAFVKEIQKEREVWKNH